MLNTFQRLTWKGLKIMSNIKVINMKIVTDFKPYNVE
jgi:hypothetical protein